MSSDYQEQLKDPRWERKRKKILKRDSYKCTVCGGKGELHVHHTYYINHLPPWMYPDDSLLTVCRECHDEYHKTHELTILTEHISIHPKKHHKKSSFKKRKQKKVEKPSPPPPKVSKKKQRGFPLDKLQEKLGKTIYRKRE